MIDMPDMSPQYTPVMIVQASQAQRSAGKTDRTIGVCKLVGNPMRFAAINGLGPIGAAKIYFENAGNLEAVGPAVLSVLSKPQHGTLKPMADAPELTCTVRQLTAQRTRTRARALCFAKAAGRAPVAANVRPHM